MDNKLPNQTKSYWQEANELTDFPPLEENIEADVAIVGGGITGITAAYLLAKEGVKVALLEADQLLSGTTGHTTAKITAQHDLIYDELITNLGRSKARLYYEANTEALQFVENTVNKLDIDCDFSKQDAYLYATSDNYADKVKKEAEAYKKLRITGELADTMPFDLNIKNALVMKDQAQFHPVKYLSRLVKEITEKGGRIFENTTAVNVKTGDKSAVLTRDGFRVEADRILACSHFPFYEGLGLYATRLSADRSYILAVKPKQKFPGGMYISADQPARSLRSVMMDGEEIVLIVGESHKTGQGKDTMEHFKALETFGEQTIGIEKVLFRWSAQDLTSLDKVPYVGEITAGQPNILVATGYRKWGMSNGTAAALLLRDIVMDKKNRFRDLYTPARFHANPSLKNFLVENANVASHLIKGKFEMPGLDPDNLGHDEGAVISMKGERKGAYKDEAGKLHIVDTTCTHMGCEVEWNSGERTWDCPCHGSRFSYTGDVVEGPAEKPLQQYDYKLLDNMTSEDSGY